jgi:hypothetical protein
MHLEPAFRRLFQNLTRNALRERKALTRMEASTTALGGIRSAFLVYYIEDFGFLLPGWFPPGDADGLEQNHPGIRHFSLQIVSLLEARSGWESV